MNRVCDKVSDCPNHEDESGCDSIHCPGLLKCKGDNVCVHPTNICNGIVDCKVSGDDEALCSMPPCPVGCVCHGLATQCSFFNERTQLPIWIKALILKEASIILKGKSFHQYTRMFFGSARECDFCLRQHVFDWPVLYTPFAFNNEPFASRKNTLIFTPCSATNFRFE